MEDFERATRRSPDVLWDREDTEFTPWLEENIDYLNESLDSSFTVTERERSTPTGFSIDLVVEAEDGDRTGVIECQLNESDHDHLGKLLAYTTAFEANIGVWIVKEPRYEHRLTIEWLNEVTEKFFYLVTIEAIEIKGTLAPLFTPVTVPSPAVKEIGEEKREPSERDLKQERFWEELFEKSEDFDLFSNISSKQQGWISKGVGHAGVYYRYRIRNEWADIGLYISAGTKEENEEIFDKLQEHKDKIETEFDNELDWQRLKDSKACRVVYQVTDTGLKDEEEWDDIQDEMVSNMKKFKSAIEEPIEKL